MYAHRLKKGLNCKISIFLFLPLLLPLNHRRGRGDEGCRVRGAVGTRADRAAAAGRRARGNGVGRGTADRGEREG
jgi:hypothetical protein